MANAALIIAAKNLADSVAGSGFTVNTVSPGAVSGESIEIGHRVRGVTLL